jgi:hypothetical protein
MKFEFFRTEWPLKLTILKIGLPLSILYFITTLAIMVMGGVSSSSIFIHLFYFILFFLLSYKSSQNFINWWSKLSFFIFHLFLLLIIPVLLSFALFGLVFLGLGSDTMEFLKHN